MTVSYSLNVSRATFGGFGRLLFRWKGSIFKSLWRESLLFCTLYILINSSYRHALNEQQKEAFTKVVEFVKYFMDVIPFYFIVGFYVSTVTGRWMSQFVEIPWPDKVCHVIASFVHGSDERSRMIRRTLARYTILLQVLTYQMVSTAVRKRFPTTQHLVKAGIMTAEERSVYEKVDFAFGKWWLPCHWFTALATRAKKEGRIKDSLLLKAIFEEMFSLRDRCAAMIGYDWIGIPLAYTQVATIATYLYAFSLLVGTQTTEAPSGLSKFTADYYFPFVSVWRFFFSAGWLKVGEQLLNPYGDDDDDFELNWMLDRAVNLAYDTSDTYHMMHPKVRRDAFWDTKDIRLPQTAHSAKFLKNPEIGSAIGLEIQEADYLPINELCEKDDDEYRYQSVKKKDAARQNSSFIRRVLNSGFAQSLRRKSRKTAVGRSLSCTQGISNAAFSISEENVDVSSTHSTPPRARKSSQINLVKKNNCGGKRNSKKCKPKNVVQKKISYNLDETEMHKIATSPDTVGSEATTVSAVPEVTVSTDLVERNESQNDFEENPEDHDGLMPPILEEAVRANSLANIESIPLPQKSEIYDQSLDFVTEVSEKLLVYRETASAQERWKENEGKGYESCCISSEELSEGSLDEGEEAKKLHAEPVRVTIEQKLDKEDILQSTKPVEV